jgi:hypothetical protein
MMDFIFNKKVSWCAHDLSGTDKVVFKNCWTRLYPASAYKIFIAAAILQDENVKLTDCVKLSESDPKTDLFPTNSTTLPAGAEYTVSDLMTQMLQQSDNRASNTLASITNVDKYLARKIYSYTGKTPKFKNNKRCMYSEKIATNAFDMAMFAADIEFTKDEYYQSQMKKFLCGKDNPGFLDGSIWHKGGNLTAMPNKGPKFLRKYYNVKYLSEVAVIEHHGLKYAIAILTRYNTLRNSMKELDLKKIQKKIERKLR